MNIIKHNNCKKKYTFKINGSKKKHSRTLKGGKAFTSGGFGCVFSPSLKCSNNNDNDNNNNNNKFISKLMTTKYADSEYELIMQFKPFIKKIKNYKKYFIMDDITLCKPKTFSENDLVDFNKKCKSIVKKGIDSSNINDKLNEVKILNVPNGGIPIDNYFEKFGFYENMIMLNKKLINLFKYGIIPMNKHHVYHSDIKSSNILIELENDKNVRLIDWGLAVKFDGKESEEFPDNWRNRPFQYNVPLSNVLFSDLFFKMYNEFTDGEHTKVTENDLSSFIKKYLKEWNKNRGEGHYEFINEIIYVVYHRTEYFKKNINFTPNPNDFISDLKYSESFTDKIIEDYLIKILLKFTQFKSNHDVTLRKYLNEVFVKIIDVWGFLMSYYCYLESFMYNYDKLTTNEFEAMNHLSKMYIEYLYEPRIEPISSKSFISDLNHFNTLLHKINTKINSSSGNISSAITPTYSY